MMWKSPPTAAIPAFLGMGIAQHAFGSNKSINSQTSLFFIFLYFRVLHSGHRRYKQQKNQQNDISYFFLFHCSPIEAILIIHCICDQMRLHDLQIHTLLIPMATIQDLAPNWNNFFSIDLLLKVLQSAVNGYYQELHNIPRQY